MHAHATTTLRRLTHRPILHLALVGAMALGLTACGDDDGESSGSTTTAPSATDPTTDPTIPAGDGAIEPGTYTIPSSVWSVAEFEVTFPEGWAAQYGHVYVKHQDEPDELSFYAVVVDEIFTDACEGDGVPLEVGPTVDDLVAALREQPGPTASGPVDTTLGGHPATRIDLGVPAGLDLQTCRLWEDGVDGLQVWYSQPADKHLVVGSDTPASVYVLDVDGDRQVFVTQAHTGTSELDTDELQDVLDSIRIS